MARFINRMLMAALVSVASASWAGDWPDAEPMSADQLEAASGRQGIPLQWQLNESEQNGVLGIFRPKTTKCSGGLSGRGLQRGITFP